MRILVLGASGGCGRWVTRLAVAGGHAVTALRPPLHVAEESAKRLVPAMEAAGIGRVVAISAASAGDSLPVTNAAMRWLLR